tara:strand:- start:10045 stop:10206 length:162 start_codon:yes stop_codon:yes gene_type:complete
VTGVLAARFYCVKSFGRSGSAVSQRGALKQRFGKGLAFLLREQPFGLYVASVS